MRAKARIPLTATCLCALLLSSAGLAADYWPIAPGITWNYGTSASSTYPVQMGVSDTSFWLVEPSLFLSPLSRFVVNGDGDIEAKSWTYFHEYGIRYAIFDPPLLFLDFPLDVGKTWETVNATGGLRGEVLREETVTVPAGTFQTKVVRITDILNGGLFVGDFYLDRNIGNVKHRGVGLFSFSGPTAAESQQSWGSVKALFR
ncbi:MAG: hypothetical protein IPJ24_17495 [bacterium]|nr:hypothetical protein [bacterium]